MATDGSRYSDAEYRVVAAHDYDETGSLVKEDGDEITPVIRTRRTAYRLPTLPLPEQADSRYMIKETDTWHLMAKRVFNDSTLWWVLCDANPHIRHPLDVRPADLITIPT